MKNLFLIVSFFYLNSASSQDWVPAKSPPLNTIGSVHMQDTNLVYVTGENKVFKSKDRGQSWTKIWESEGIAESVHVVTTSSTGRLYSGYNQIDTDWAKLIYSDDEGITWEEKSVPLVNELQVIHFHNNTVGFVGGDEYLVRTDDGGETWKVVANRSGINFYTIQFLTDSIGILAGGAEPQKVLFRTEDGGKTWSTVSAGGLEHYRAQFPTENIGYVASLNWVSKSIDGGKNWSRLKMPANENYFQLYFPTADVGYVTTSDFLSGGWDYGSKIFKTIDGGETWTENFVDEPQLYRIHDIDFKGRYGIMVGELSGVYVTELDRLLSSKDIEDKGGTISLYPNPTTGFINVNIEKDFSYDIYSSQGALITSGESSDSMIDVQKLFKGFYRIVISTRDEFYNSSFIKIN